MLVRIINLNIDCIGVSEVQLIIDDLSGWFETALPIEVMVVGPIFTIMGGGDCVFMATAYATIMDIAKDEVQRPV